MNAVAEQFQNQPEADAPPVPLIFTDSAAAKVKELVDEEGNPDLKLRVFVQGAAARVSSTASPSTNSSTTTTRR